MIYVHLSWTWLSNYHESCGSVCMHFIVFDLFCVAATWWCVVCDEINDWFGLFGLMEFSALSWLMYCIRFVCMLDLYVWMAWLRLWCDAPWIMIGHYYYLHYVCDFMELYDASILLMFIGWFGAWWSLDEFGMKLHMVAWHEVLDIGYTWCNCLKMSEWRWTSLEAWIGICLGWI